MYEFDKIYEVETFEYYTYFMLNNVPNSSKAVQAGKVAFTHIKHTKLEDNKPFKTQ